MFIYFIEQVWAYDQHIVNETCLIQRAFWDLRYGKKEPVYPFPWMEEGTDWLDY